MLNHYFKDTDLIGYQIINLLSVSTYFNAAYSSHEQVWPGEKHLGTLQQGDIC